MIYIFIIFAAVAIMFIALGALSVWVSVLSMALKGIMAVAVAVPVVAILYKRLFGRKS